MMTDPIADMLTRIRNAHTALHDAVEMPGSTMKADVARVLKDQGYITDFAVAELFAGLELVAAGRAPGRPGICSREPAITWSGLLIPLIWISRSVLVPKRSAISERVSPLFTV